jgi:hypothetical protein
LAQLIKGVNEMRKVRVGEHYVFHDDLKYVYEVTAVKPDEVWFYNMATMHAMRETPNRFNEFYTRVPV